MLTSFCAFSQTQDTLRLMTYNLMFYRENTSFCTNNNNNPSAKDAYLKTILDHVSPDILVVNEMGTSLASSPFTLLRNAINKSGRNFWFANSSANQSQSLMNMLYFNTKKLALHKQYTIDKDIKNKNIVRKIDVYQLYYKAANLSSARDTVFLNIIAAHLKAGSSSASKSERADATAGVMAKLDSTNINGNYFFVGDLNLYRSTDSAYQHLTNYIEPQLRFYDPVNVSGDWSKSNFSSLHTQSTHTQSGCYSGGGMDNRFDFILVSDDVLHDSSNVGYIPNSYTTVGQDGLRYNGNLTSPANASAPAAVISALYGMSDHLPVTVDLQLTISNVTALREVAQLNQPLFKNPVKENLSINLSKIQADIVAIKVIDISGKTLLMKKGKYSGAVDINVSRLKSGIYILQLMSASGRQSVNKFMIK